MRADGGELGRGDAAQAPRPILRVGEERARGRELSRESALKVEDLAPEVEPARQVRRQRLLERRAKLVVFGRDVAVDVELIVDGGRRGVRVPDQHARRAMRRDRNRFDGKLRAELLQRANEERPGALRLKPPVRPVGHPAGSMRWDGRARPRPCPRRRTRRPSCWSCRCQHGDAAVHPFSPDGTFRRATPRVWSSRAAVSASKDARRSSALARRRSRSVKRPTISWIGFPRVQKPGGRNHDRGSTGSRCRLRSRTCRCSPW